MEIIEFLKQHGNLRLDATFKELTTIKIGGAIKYLFSPFDFQQLRPVIRFLKAKQIPYKLLGHGSNLVCGDQAYEGCVIRLDQFQAWHFIDDNLLYAEAGIGMPFLANLTAQKGYANLEFSSGIPGTLGGLVYMNAGAYKKEMSDIVQRVFVLKDEQFVWLKKEELAFSYRNSIFHKHPDWLILAAELSVCPQDSKIVKELIQDRLLRRKATQPLDLPSAGSCFKNPRDNYAWQLIDGAGLRGYRADGIEISAKHPNFIVNKGNGQATDFIKAAELIKSKVKERYGIELLMEVELFNC